MPYWWVFGPFTSTPGSSVLVNASAAGSAFQKQIATDADFEWVMTMGKIFQGDSRFIQLQFIDLSTGPTSGFSSDPLDFDNFAGDGAKLAFPILIPYTFGRQSQLKLIATQLTIPVSPAQVIGIGNGAATTFTGVLQTPVQPGTVTVTAGVVVGTDGVTANNAIGNNGAITNAAGTITGTVNYQTGAISVTFTAAPAANVLVTVAYSLGVGQTTLQVTLHGYMHVGSAGLTAGAGPSGPVSGQ